MNFHKTKEGVLYRMELHNSEKNLHNSHINVTLIRLNQNIHHPEYIRQPYRTQYCYKLILSKKAGSLKTGPF